MTKKYLFSVIIIVFAVAVSIGIYFLTLHRATPQSIGQKNTPNCSQTDANGDGGGTIVAISGNKIIAHDSNQTTTITIGSDTRYYQPDLFTVIPSSSLIELGQYISVAGYKCELDSNGLLATIDATNGFVSRVPRLSDIAAPAEWYAHRITAGAIVFTRHDRLSIPSATEGFALGEQINANAATLDHRPIDWAVMNIGTENGTIGTPPQNDWGELDGYQTIKATIGTEADDELIYAIFVPKQYTVYEFALYPYPNATDTPIFDALVKDFAKNL